MTARKLVAAALLLLGLDWGDGAFQWWPLALLLVAAAAVIAWRRAAAHVDSLTTAGDDVSPSTIDVPSVASPAVLTLVQIGDMSWTYRDGDDR